MSIRTPRLSRRHLLAAGVSAAGLTALSACGGPAPGKSDAGGEPAGALRVLTPIFDKDDGKRLLDSLIKQFVATYPRVTIAPDYTDYGHLNEKLTTSLASGRPYDVMLIGVGWVPPFAAKGVLGDLGEDPAELAKTYNQRAVDPGVYQGKVYALPIMLDTRFGIYRKDIFADAGLTGPPKNFAEMRAQAKQLTVRDGSGKLTRAGLDILSNDLRQTYETLLWANGGDLFTADLSAPAFNSGAGVGALQFMVDVIRTDKSEDFGFTTPGAVSIPLLDGRAAMMLGHNNFWLNIKQSAPDLISGGKLGTFVVANSRPALFQGGTLGTVAAASASLTAARALVKFLARPDIAVQACAQRGNVPAAPSMLSSDYVKGDAFVQFAAQNLGSSFAEGGVPAWLDIRGDFKAAIESALLGRSGAKQALDDLAAQAKKAMASK
jgi:multiple sugar transport system substrate-binding protein